MSLSLSGEYPFNNYRSSKYYLILFFIWPFLAFIVSVSNFSKKEARFIVYMFLIYYGFNFVNTNTAIDAYRYALELKINSGRSFSDFFRIVGGLYSDTNVDIVEPLISFIVSRFTSHYSLYFAVWAAIFGFFYLKSINLIQSLCITSVLLHSQSSQTFTVRSLEPLTTKLPSILMVVIGSLCPFSV